MEKQATDDLRPEYPDENPDLGDAEIGVPEGRPDPPPSMPGANKKEPDGPAGEERITRDRRRESPPEPRVRKSRTDRNEPDKEVKKIWARLQRISGGTIRVKVAKQTPQGQFAFVRGSVVEFNPHYEDSDDLERSIVQAYGVGTFRITFLPPRGSGLQAFSYVFTYTDPRFENESQVSVQTTPSGVMKNPEGADPSGRLADLSQPAKLAATGNDRTGEGRGSDPNGPLVGLVTKLLEATMDEQQKRFDRLNSSIEGLTKSLTERQQEPPPTPDVSKTIEAVAGACKGIMELARVQQPASPPPPSVQTGLSDFEKTLALADRLAKLTERRVPSASQQPANINESLVTQVLKLFSEQLEKMGQEPLRKQPSFKDHVESIAKIMSLVRENGLNPETVGEIGEVLDEDRIEEKPGPFKSFLQGLVPLIGVIARDLGTGLGTGFAKGLGDLAPGMAGSVFPPKSPTPPQPPSAPVQPQSTMGVNVKGAAQFQPATFPRNNKQSPIPPKTLNPAPAEPRPPIPDMPGGNQGPDSKTDAKTSTSFPDTPEKRPAMFPYRKMRPPIVPPEGIPPLATMTDGEFRQFITVLQMPIPAQQVAKTIIHQIPDEARQYLTLPADESWKLAEVCLTPSQREAAQPMMPRIREVFGEMKILLDNESGQKKSDH